jgi:hypothetical protein
MAATADRVVRVRATAVRVETAAPEWAVARARMERRELREPTAAMALPADRALQVAMAAPAVPHPQGRRVRTARADREGGRASMGTAVEGATARWHTPMAATAVPDTSAETAATDTAR